MKGAVRKNDRTICNNVCQGGTTPGVWVKTSKTVRANGQGVVRRTIDLHVHADGSGPGKAVLSSFVTRVNGKGMVRRNDICIGPCTLGQAVQASQDVLTT